MKKLTLILLVLTFTSQAQINTEVLSELQLRKDVLLYYAVGHDVDTDYSMRTIVIKLKCFEDTSQMATIFIELSNEFEEAIQFKEYLELSLEELEKGSNVGFMEGEYSIAVTPDLKKYVLFGEAKGQCYTGLTIENIQRIITWIDKIGFKA